MEQKKVAAIHDISGIGKCSLTVVLPVLSAAGLQACPVPTAVLSSHTGGFEGIARQDLTSLLPAYIRQWKQLGLRFDALYSGYLASAAQVENIEDLFDGFHVPGSTLALVDPVLGDGGRLYESCTPELVNGMIRLCQKADLIVPNMTEAALLLGEKYKDGPYTRTFIEKLLYRLSGLGPRRVVLTGVWFSPELLGAAGLDADTGLVTYAFSRRVAGRYFGTGDLFASILLSGLLNGMNLKNAMQLAVDFTCSSIRRTKDAGDDPRFGVNFESGLPGLMQELGRLDPL